ncbi:centrosome-associated protein 350-like [Sitophilus oryzae]|uniref:Centrosome-associated protein 350-like n=1 Tax=Sitophilus oryzae TaxID=7048 RepID=A0A6J2XZW3_SITOR|nr:centrosome-associated protein 350-like [Sitophilus oryzae]
MDKESVAKRILETAKETERLKEELQNLIASGIKGNINYSKPESNDILGHSSNKVQIIKSYDSKHSLHPKKQGTSNPDIVNAQSDVALSPKKKSYDVKQAREYIKKQKERRLVEVNSKKTDSKTALELRKEKLQELQQKATELVKKNVEAKRQRSKSREPPIIRSRSNSREPRGTLRNRSVSREKAQANLHRDSIIHGYNCAGRSKNYVGKVDGKISDIKEPRIKDSNLLYLPEPNYCIKPFENVENKLSPKIQNTEVHYTSPVSIKNHGSNQDIAQASSSLSENIPAQKRGRSRRDMSINENVGNKPLTPNNSYKENFKLVSDDTGPQKPIEHFVEPIDSKKKIIVLSNMTLRPPDIEPVLKEPQKTPVEFPEWLKDSAPQTDPYNFINTVRRQLKFAINSDRRQDLVDVGVQDSFKNPSLSEKSNKKSDLKSFLSHKCLNLDPRALDHIEIGGRSEPSVKDGKTITKSNTNSESDTSKNIPSIPTESRTSVKKYSDFKSESSKISNNEMSSHKSSSIIELMKAKSINSETYSSSSFASQDNTKNVKSSDSQSKKKSSVSKSRSSVSEIEEIVTEELSDVSSDKENMSDFALIEPKVSLRLEEENKKIKTYVDKQASLRKISIKNINEEKNLNNSNQIHLKFEAEIHLLNDFNKSLRHFAEIEKEFESLRCKNDSETMAKKILHTRDTQTSIVNSISQQNSSSSKRSKISHKSSKFSSINYSRGSFETEEIPNLELRSDTSEIHSHINLLDLNSTSQWKDLINDCKMDNETVMSEKTSSIIQYSSRTFDGSITKRSDVDHVNDENFMFRNVAGISLKMFDQLIKDEDLRIENLKKIVKIREHALLDKTRSELVWLEMQKKQFIETKRFEEASLIKRKQRGILLRHQQERQEMQRLKQMQKEASSKRKTVLRQQRNGIKNQLHSGSMPLAIIKTGSRDRSERRTSGPLKVIQTNSIHSETSLSIAGTATDQEIQTLTSRTRSMVNVATTVPHSENSELESVEFTFKKHKSISDSALTDMKQKLLMREQALSKRRKTVEELLQWHQKLLHEERAIEDLETKVKTIVSKIPSEKEEEKLSNSDEPSPKTQITLSEMSRVEVPQHQAEETEDSSKTSYNTDDFEADNVTSISSISQLIEDFNKIEDKILNFSLVHTSKPPEEEKQEEQVSSRSSQLISEIEEEETDVESVKMIEDPGEEDEPDKAPNIEETDNLINFSENTLEEDTKLDKEEDEEPSLVEEIEENVPEDTVSFKEPDNVLEENAESVEDTDTASKKDIENYSVIVISDSVSVSESSTVKEDIPELEEISNPVTDYKSSTSHEVSSSNEDLNSSVEASSVSDEVVSSPRPEEIHEDVPSNSEAPTLVEMEVVDHFTQTSSNIYSENKTDEEKAASLSQHQNSVNFLQNFPVQEEENTSSTSVSVASEAETEKIPEEGASTSSNSEENSQTIVDIPEEVQIEESEPTNHAGSSSSSVEEEVSQKSSQSSPEADGTKTVDVKKRVREIMSEASQVTGAHKSPRMQDLCVMTYDLNSPNQSPDSGSPLDERKSFSLGNEAEELLKKQLAIEQEIKLLTEQQQKEQVPLVYIREIPNKPPPPYTPPSKVKSVKVASIIPNTKEEVEQIAEYSSKIIHKAYLSKNLDNISISDKTLSLIAKNVDKGCYKYVFDLCKEIAIEHYSQFSKPDPGSSWLRVEDKGIFLQQKPLDVIGLQQLMNSKLLELFGFQKKESRKENAIIKWSRKKRDHVDEVLIQEMQNEESTWTNFELNELYVKDRITNEIMEMLIKNTALVLKQTLYKKNQDP